MKRQLYFERLRYFHDWGWLGFALVFALLLMWPNTARLAPSSGYDAEMPALQELMKADTKQQEKAPAKADAKGARPTQEDLRKEQDQLYDLTAAIENQASPWRLTQLMYRLRRSMVAQINAGRVYVDSGGTPMDVLPAREDAAVLKILVRRHQVFMPAAATNLPASLALARTLQRGVPALWLLLFIAVWSSYYLIWDKRSRVGEFTALVPLRQGTILLAKQVVFWVIASATTITVFALALVIPVLTSGVGDARYPLAFSPTGQAIQVMTAGRFVLLFLLSILALLAFMAAVNSLLQQLIGNYFVVLLLLMALCVAGPTLQLGSFAPFAYLDPAATLLPQGNSGILTPGWGPVILAGWAALLGTVSLIVAARRQRL
ncbi:hypothetical protein ACFQ3L_03180 [Lacticaseibacillus jixianensis]|uniref:ABC transporter permease n=1 Tax=Lacticaseibacillus jixianensis TaxID=2486012 RepID=A0ABW4B7A4_9LACO|nr:hypothetical protein [Lacticaseibacillus jixianensis]